MRPTRDQAYCERSPRDAACLDALSALLADRDVYGGPSVPAVISSRASLPSAVGTCHQQIRARRKRKQDLELESQLPDEGMVLRNALQHL